MKKWELFSEDDLQKIVKESISFREVANKCGYSTTGGGSITAIKEMISYYNFDISHFLGQGWNKDNFDYSRFRYGNKIKSRNALQAIIALRGHKCENCGSTEWLNNPIPLEVHHIDGKELNSELDNLILLCPNCHALTDKYRGRNINKQTQNVNETEFVDALKNSSSIRQALISLGLTPKGGNYIRANELIQKYQIEKFLVGAPG